MSECEANHGVFDDQRPEESKSIKLDGKKYNAALKRIEKGELHLENRYCKKKVTKTTRELSARGEELVNELETFLQELLRTLQSKNLANLSEANHEFRGLINRDDYLDLKDFLENLGRASNHEGAARDFYKIRQFMRDAQALHPRLKPAILRMIRGECRSISERLTTWLKKSGDYGVAPPFGAGWFHFHTAAACPLLEKRASETMTEHSVTLNHIHNKILGLPTPYDRSDDAAVESVDQIAKFLRANFIISSFLQAEEKKISSQFKNSMGKKWYWRKDCDERITTADIGRYNELKFDVYNWDDHRCVSCQRRKGAITTPLIHPL